MDVHTLYLSLVIAAFGAFMIVLAGAVLWSKPWTVDLSKD